MSRRVIALGLALAAVASGCGSGEEPRQDPRGAAASPPAEEAPPNPECREGRAEKLGDEAHAYAALAAGRVTAFARPGGKALRTFGPVNVNGVRTVFAARRVLRGADCEAAWYLVQLPIRPNGVTGWIRAADVTVFTVDERIEVDISERTVVLFRSGRRVLSVTAAVGSEATPTPTGRYYVNQRLRAADPSGPFGPGGVGISAFSPVLTGWAQGGPIAIHGTNSPETIGEPVTNGCLRIDNAELLRLFSVALEGTPVVIRA